METPRFLASERLETFTIGISRIPAGHHEFAAHQAGGQDVVWDAATKNLHSLCKHGLRESHNLAVTAMAAAAGAWEAAADVDFIYTSQEDNNCRRQIRMRCLMLDT